MPKPLKFLIGLAAALLAGWISHDPLGRGTAFADRIEAPLQPLLDELNVEGLSGRVQREPLARVALLSGPANCFQRNGLGSMPGIDERILAIPGMARVEWSNPPPEGECR